MGNIISASPCRYWLACWWFLRDDSRYLFWESKCLHSVGKMLKCIVKAGRANKAVECVWNVMAHAQKPYFVFRRNGRFHLNRRGRQFSRLLAGELCTSACRVCTVRASLCSAVMWRLLVTHSILLFPLHFSRASPCAITFQTQSNTQTVHHNISTAVSSLMTSYDTYRIK
jgi:hypothetical protein